MTVRFHPDAESELRDSFFWYDRQRKGLGDEFILCVDETVERIRRTPEVYPRIFNNIRRTTVKRFPFALFYEVDDEGIRVIAVFHSRRNPKRWHSRS
jgi:toxin ParE1/3/4